MFVKRIPRDQPFIITMEAEIKKFLAELTVKVDKLNQIIRE